MILMDFSSTVHRMIHRSVAQATPGLDSNNKFITSEFIALTKYHILQDIFEIIQKNGRDFGDLIICLDNAIGGYWRKDVYSGYKSNRRKSRNESNINFSEVFKEIDGLILQIKENLPWKVLSIPRAEADDAMLILAKEYNSSEKILIFSPDKDMIQAQRDSDNVFQYSALTQKWLAPETKHDHMDHWIQEHVCLGDASDEVPKVVDNTEFSTNFLKYLRSNNLNIKNPMEFKAIPILALEEKRFLISSYDVYKTNRKGESTGVKDIYKDMRFGPAALKKKIKEHGSLDAWLDSHELYRTNYERNFTLIMVEGIPEYISAGILKTFSEAKSEYNILAFEEYLINNNLKSILLELPNYIKIGRDLTADDFGW